MQEANDLPVNVHLVIEGEEKSAVGISARFSTKIMMHKCEVAVVSDTGMTRAVCRR